MIAFKDYFSGNKYPGRGVFIGTSPNGKNAVLAYFIMGRSENSRNRVFEERGERLTILPYDASKLSDPSLIIYDPVICFENHIIISNGDQSATIEGFLKDGKSFEDALRTRCFEPDAPNYTPRISGMITMQNESFSYKMSILKRVGGGCFRAFYEYPSREGIGDLLTTYICDGEPLPSYSGEPAALCVRDDIDEFSNEIWASLDGENRISLYLRFIELKTGKSVSRLINKNI